MIFRTRFAREIVAEFAPPASRRPPHRVILLCDGLPSVPRKQSLMEFLAARGYWVFYPHGRGAWESGGNLLELSPERDLHDLLDELPRGVRESAFGRRMRLAPRRLFVVGGSFGGAAAVLASLDPRVDKVIANCPVVDWRLLPRAQKKETSNPSYAAYLREGFGGAYRLSEQNWRKLQSGGFFNPATRAADLDGAKILIFHAQDDPYIPWRQVQRFASNAGIRLNLLSRGGHLRTETIARRYWRTISRFFAS